MRFLDDVDVIAGNLIQLNPASLHFVSSQILNDTFRARLEAWGAGSGSTVADIEWLVADQLGTPRMIFDKTGSLANTKRHDYLPFGEELFANQGLRTGTMGYIANDGVRQKFTQKERDNETGLDYLEARYYSSTQGRFTSPDEPFADQEEDDPQSWNLYSYVRNNPIRFIDPTGEGHIDPKTGAYVGDKDGECEDGLCWDAKNNVWVDKVPVNGGSVTPPPETVNTQGIMAGEALGLALALSPPPVKAAVGIGGVLIGGAVLAAYLDSTTIHIPATPLGPITTVTSPKIEIAGPVPPPPPIMKKKGEKRQIRAAARQVGVTYIALRNAVHQFKKDMKMRGNENLDWETLIAVAEEIKRRLEK